MTKSERETLLRIKTLLQDAEIVATQKNHRKAEISMALDLLAKVLGIEYVPFKKIKKAKISDLHNAFQYYLTKSGMLPTNHQADRMAAEMIAELPAPRTRKIKKV